MIIPLQCKSCGKFIAHLWFKYISICEDYQDRQAKGEPLPGNETPQALALHELKIERYCCRLMFICQPENLVDYIRNRKQ